MVHTWFRHFSPLWHAGQCCEAFVGSTAPARRARVTLVLRAVTHLKVSCVSNIGGRRRDTVAHFVWIWVQQVHMEKGDRVLKCDSWQCYAALKSVIEIQDTSLIQNRLLNILVWWPRNIQILIRKKIMLVSFNLGSTAQIVYIYYITLQYL